MPKYTWTDLRCGWEIGSVSQKQFDHFEMIPFDGHLQRGESILQSIHTFYLILFWFSQVKKNQASDEEYYEDNII